MQTVLHVPFTYFPDPCGGTEVYVDALAQGLGGHGFRNAIAAPGERTARYLQNGLPVHRFEIDRRAGFAAAYGAPDMIAANNFRAIVEEIAPAIVHLHAHTSAVSACLVDVAHDMGAKVVFTYHTPTASCARGTMMLFGAAACDGAVERRRCTACALQGSGAPRPLAWLAAALPKAVAGRLARLPIKAGPAARLRAPGLIAERGAWFTALAGRADAVVAVCAWVRAVLRRNGIPSGKIILSRQGIPRAVAHPLRPRRSGGGPLRIVYFGRLDRVKGVDLLVGALRRRPRADVLVDIYAVLQPGNERGARSLRAIASVDPRIRLFPAVPPGEVIHVMSGYDFVAAPSRWLETGPLVVLEAFAAGVPVIGAALGGIAELVHDGLDGILLPPDDLEAWARMLDRLTAEPGIAERLRDNIMPPRTMEDVAAEMAKLYGQLAESSSWDARSSHHPDPDMAVSGWNPGFG